MSTNGELYLLLNEHSCEFCKSFDYSTISLTGNQIETVCDNCAHREIFRVPEGTTASLSDITDKEAKEFKEYWLKHR